MCLNNWGGIDHKVLEFHEYVNLFSGKSGSGKSTLLHLIGGVDRPTSGKVYVNDTDIFSMNVC